MPTSATPTPPIMVVLPDGEQEVRGRLHRKLQTRQGWMFWVGLPMWRGTPETGVEPAEYRVWLTTAQVRPIDGVRYDAVHTEYLTQAAPTAEITEARWGWKVQRLPHRTGGGTVIHMHDCSDAPRNGSELDLDEALTALRRPGARACQTCDAAAALTPLA